MSRPQTAITSSDVAQRTAPLIAGAIVLVSLVLYKVLKPKNVVAKMRLKATARLTTKSKSKGLDPNYSLEDFLGAESVL